MTGSNEWEQAFALGGHDSRWPWSDLVSMVRRHARALDMTSRILEIGCGVGANIPFLLSTGAQYFALEGSPTAVRTVRERFPQLADRVQVANFTTEIPFDGPFDVVVDRAAMTHNDEQAIRHATAQLASKMRPGGLYIGIDWFSSAHSGACEGRAVSRDSRTRTDFESGPFAGVGRVHFSDEAHLRDIFSGWRWIALEEKVIHTTLPQAAVIAAWNFVLARS